MLNRTPMSRGTGFKRPVYQRVPPSKPSRVTRGVAAVIEQTVIAQPKEVRLKRGKAELQHKDALARLGCMCCRRLGVFSVGPVVLHHMRAGGWGKGDYTTLIPLCVEHHTGDSGVHGLGTKGFAKTYGFDQQNLLDDAKDLLRAV